MAKKEVKFLGATPEGADWKNLCADDLVRVGAYRFFRLVATASVAVTLDHLKAFWVADVIWSYLPRLIKKGEGFAVVTVTKNPRSAGCKFEMHDGGGQPDGSIKKYATQKIEYTDLTENLKFYVCRSEQGFTMMFPVEY